MNEMAKYLKENPLMELSFRYDKDIDSIFVDYKNRTFPSSYYVGRAVHFDQIQTSERPWLLFHPPKELR